MLGRYLGACKARGRPQRPQIVHVWRVKDGKAAQFHQYADTLHIARVIGRVS